MAYRDYNGTITIDEMAANRDISKINQVIPKLQSARSTLITLRSQAASTKGLTGAAIQLKSTMLIKQIEKQISQLEETASLIKRVVKHYQVVDARVKAKIEAGKWMN